MCTNKILDVDTLNNLISSLGYKGQQIKSIRLFENFRFSENEWVLDDNTYELDVMSDTSSVDFVTDLEKYTGISIIIGSIN
jgi:hypothetical protein